MSDGGITSAEGDHFDTRFLSSGGAEAWNFIKRAHDEVWEKLGFDANTFYCPESADEIDLEADQSQSDLVQPDLYPVPSAPAGFLDASMAWPTLPSTEEAFPPHHSMVDFATMDFERF